MGVGKIVSVGGSYIGSMTSTVVGSWLGYSTRHQFSPTEWVQLDRVSYYQDMSITIARLRMSCHAALCCGSQAGQQGSTFLHWQLE